MRSLLDEKKEGLKQFPSADLEARALEPCDLCGGQVVAAGSYGDQECLVCLSCGAEYVEVIISDPYATLDICSSCGDYLCLPCGVHWADCPCPGIDEA